MSASPTLFNKAIVIADISSGKSLNQIEALTHRNRIIAILTSWHRPNSGFMTKFTE
tara:strand:- start:558 stop:725 length:168 start_codon:yes stop_codon:yes gene_type:complete